MTIVTVLRRILTAGRLNFEAHISKVRMGTIQGALQEALQNMDDSALTVDQLDALSRAVPDDTERKDIKLYLKVATLPQLWAPVAVREGPKAALT